MANIPIYIPTYISDDRYNPSKVLPRLLFYNNKLQSEDYYLEGYPSGSTGSLSIVSQSAFPYFDNYNVVTGSFPTTGSKSLLFFNETAAYGSQPNTSVYSEYWNRYVELLYNPYTKLLNCSAIIPLADYRNINQNDIVEFRGSYYHLRAINDYSLKNGECSIQLLGPILDDALNLPKVLFPKCLGYDETDCLLACYNKCECTPPCPPSQFFFSSVPQNEFVFQINVTTAPYTLSLPIKQTTLLTNLNVEDYPTLFTASWGDGSPLSYISGSNNTTDSLHTYSQTGSYEVRLKGKCAQFGNNTTDGAMYSLRSVLTEVKEWGSMNFARVSFNSCEFLSTIPDGCPGMYSILTHISMFDGLAGFSPDPPPIGNPPANLFKWCFNAGLAQSHQAVFARNLSITEIPERLFYYQPWAYFFASCFSGCFNITKLPNELFAPRPNYGSDYVYFHNIGSTFRAMFSLQSIPPNLFDPLLGSVNSYAFNTFSLPSTATPIITGSAPQLWSTPNSNTWNASNFFENQTALSNYASIPGGWK